MKPSSTVISDLKAEILEADPFEEAVKQFNELFPERPLDFNCVATYRIALLDFLLDKLDVEKIDTKEDFELVFKETLNKYRTLFSAALTA